MNGSRSTDDKGISSYQWLQFFGPPVEFINADTAQPLFTAPGVEFDGVSMAFQLTVQDTETLRSSDIILVNVSCEDTKGDIDGNCEVELKDAVLSLLALTGSSGLSIRPDYNQSVADVDSNDKVGLPETIYILNSITE